MNQTKVLSKKDILLLFDLISETLTCADRDELKKIILRCRELFPFEFSVAGCSNIRHMLTNPNFESEVVNISYPPEYLKRYFEKGYHLKDIIIQEYFRTLELVNFSETIEKYAGGKKTNVDLEAEEAGIVDGFIYGIRDLDFSQATSFTFADYHIENCDRTKLIIKILVPHLSEALKRIVTKRPPPTAANLSKREIEVLSWLKEGKSSWEISVILGISENTVNFHIKNIKRKLNSTKRMQAVAVALGQKLIQL
ncbi:MAG: autoinducer binding domain-containing protein [Deltaproteobacteria bacterium]|nr:autoinducer binding domain-containing protein [Deltaproteobacteria bacterium]